MLFVSAIELMINLASLTFPFSIRWRESLKNREGSRLIWSHLCVTVFLAIMLICPLFLSVLAPVYVIVSIQVCKIRWMELLLSIRNSWIVMCFPIRQRAFLMVHFRNCCSYWCVGSFSYNEVKDRCWVVFLVFFLSGCGYVLSNYSYLVNFSKKLWRH